MEAKRKRNKNIIFGCIAALFALGVALLPTILRSQQEEPTDNASYLSAQTERRDIPSTISGWGTLTDQEGVAVSVPKGVEVTEYLVTNGQWVEEGQPLAVVDKISVMQTLATVQENLDYLAKELQKAPNRVASDAIYAASAGRVKAIYAQVGDAVTDVIQTHGALAVVSLDGLMALELDTAESVSAGEEVTVVLSDGTEKPGRVERRQGEHITVTVSDDGPKLGDTAQVRTLSGTALGSGTLYVHSAWNVTAVSGTVSHVFVKENQTVGAGTQLFNLKDVDFTSEFRKLSEQHREYEEAMVKLFDLYENGALTAPAAGRVTGIDESRVGLMRAGQEEYRVVLLADEEPAAMPADPGSAKPGAYTNKIAMVSRVTYGSVTFMIEGKAAAVSSYATRPEIDLENADSERLTRFTGIDVFVWDKTNSVWKLGSPSHLREGDMLYFVYDKSGALRWIVRPDQTVELPVESWGGGGGGGYEEPFEMYELIETELMRVVPQDTMSVTVTIDELDILAVAVGQTAEITVDALPGRSYTGTVTEMDPHGNSTGSSSKYIITISIDRDENMIQGMNATAILTTGVTENVLTLPAEALSQKGSRTIVYTGFDPETRTLLDPVEVTIGASDGLTVEIVDGLAEGDTVWYSYYESGNMPVFSSGGMSGGAVTYSGGEGVTVVAVPMPEMPT